MSFQFFTILNSSLILFQASKIFQHPNIVSLYGYCFPHDLLSGYLVFEFVYHGSLDTFYKSEQKRENLSSKIRVKIMSEIILAIHYLHTGKEAKIGLFHCDIKPDNICLDQKYTVKLIDCGLAKFFLLDQSIDTSGYSFSVLDTSPAVVVGTHESLGYICPFFFKGNKYEPACDVYSFGIVMIELVTGCLQNDRTKLGDFSERYFPNDFEGTPAEAVELAIPKLVEDVDPLAAEWEDGILASVCSLAIRCIQTNRKIRPTTKDLVKELGQLVRPIDHIGEHQATDFISEGLLKMKEAMDNVNSRPIELPVEFIYSCTNNFNVTRKLGQGAFGAVYKGEYGNRVFAVKHILDGIAVKKDELLEKTVPYRTNVKTELEVSSFVVSNIACF